MKVRAHHEIGFDLITFSDACYWGIGFYRPLGSEGILERPLRLKVGDIEAGQSVEWKFSRSF